MEEAESTEQSLAALRTALLAYYDEHTSVMGRQPLLTRGERLMSQALERQRLKWLAIAVALSWLGEVAGQALEGGPGGMVDDDLATVAPWGFDPGQVGAPVLFLHGGQDRVAPCSHGRWLARHARSAELWLRPDDGHISVLNSGEAAMGWLRDRAGGSRHR
jgi:pimeloyl-ACP methyl ester carboxylesterase